MVGLILLIQNFLPVPEKERDVLEKPGVIRAFFVVFPCY